MPTFKYLMVVAAASAAAFFLVQPETRLPTNSYADVMPAAISAFPTLLPKSWGNEWSRLNKPAHEEFVSVSSF